MKKNRRILCWVLLMAMLALQPACGRVPAESESSAASTGDLTDGGDRDGEAIDEASDAEAGQGAGESSESLPEVDSPGFDPEIYTDVAEEVDSLLKAYSSSDGAGNGSGSAGGSDSGGANGSGLFDSGTDAEKVETALNLADDMAVAVHMGRVSSEMMSIGGEAVLGYPHPLLLNNYGAMVMYAGDETQAEPFFRLAVLQESGNPVYLTNLASVLLEEGDDASAEQFVDQALSIDNEYGPAYQVLTTIHLKRDENELAAETMVKGAWHYFDDLTEYQFQSFLSAVEELDPDEDDYPLKEEYLEILYKIARENVDTLDNGQGTDTPGGQLDLKPFPQITSAENLMNAQEWLDKQIDEMTEKHDDARERAYEHDDALYEMDEDGDPEHGVFSVMKNMRQYYAIKVMMSFYEYKLKQLDAKARKDLDEIDRLQNEEVDRMREDYDQRMDEAEQESDAAVAKLYAELINSAFGTNPPPDVSGAQKAVLVPLMLNVEEREANLRIRKKYAEQVLDVDARLYGDMEQPLEEYWLKTGGLLKYVADENMFEYLAGIREELVWDWIWRPLGDLESLAGQLFGEKESLGYARTELEIVRSGMEGGAPDTEEEPDKEEDSLEYGSVLPNLEKESFTTYPEPGDHGEVGVEGDLFGVVKGSASFDGDNLRWEGETPVTKHTGGISTLGGSTFSSTLRGISVEGDTSWITSMADTESLKKAGKAGKLLGSLGKISFTKSDSRMVGTYTIRDSCGRITDQGIHYVREVGSGVWDLGKSKKIEVMKSYVTGVAIRKSSTKYRFKFATYEE